MQGILNLEQDAMKEILKLGFDKAIDYLPKYLQSKTEHGDMNSDLVLAYCLTLNSHYKIDNKFVIEM